MLIEALIILIYCTFDMLSWRNSTEPLV